MNRIGFPAETSFLDLFFLFPNGNYLDGAIKMDEMQNKASKLFCKSTDFYLCWPELRIDMSIKDST